MAKKYQAGIRKIYSEEGHKLRDRLKMESYKGVSSELANSWRVVVKVYNFNVFSDDEKARWKIAGRGPGKMPPIKAITPWATAKGISPWALAISIARRGTQRWRDQKNFLNMDRQGKIRKPNPMEDTRLTIMRRVSKLKWG
jgi:hypothetical protein